MPERPLLLFPTPERADRTKQTPSPGHIHRPGFGRQGERLAPIFNQLQTAFNERRVEVQQTTAGIDPEQVLVIETVGSIEKFANAVKRIAGLEWMGELEADEIAPDEDFFDEARPDKQLSGRLYLIMTNQRALDEMLSLFRRYQADPNMHFERGLTKFRDVFLCIKDIHRWDAHDRLYETGVLEAWREDLEHDGDRPIKFEAELWFRGTLAKRQTSQTQVFNLVQQLGGRVISQCVIDDISYHALLAELPANSIRQIVENPTTELVKCDSIMFFRPVGQMSAGDRVAEGDVEAGALQEMALPTGDPVIAILDGLPLANHQLLVGRLIIDDPDDWSTDYAASERIHGTSMASLVVQGDMNDGASPLTRPVYVRPIMKPMPDDFRIPRREYVPEDVLVVDLIHRAVRRIFDGDGVEGPVAPHVKIVNLSIGDPSRQFSRAMSPLARLLDWLSVKYSILFIISAGNHPKPICLDITGEEFEQLQPNELEDKTIKALYQDARHRRLLSPAESINGLTVGAIHFDNSQVVSTGNRFDPFEQVLPSPVSAFGSGYRRAIKPDILFIGGKQWYDTPIFRNQPVNLEVRNSIIAPGNKVAYPGRQPGDPAALAYTRGTSNATALISRVAGICYDSLLQLIEEQEAEIHNDACITPLLKAMLAHGCTWGDLGSRISNALRTPENGRQIGGWISRWLGYGIPQIERVLDCTDQRATLLGFGQLSDGEAHVFSLPLPPSLGSRADWRRLTITLAWLSPVAANTQKYRNASLWFEAEGVNLAKDRKESCGGQDGWRAVRRGTVQHEVFEGQRAEPFIDGDVIQIKVNCREDAGKIVEPIPYGIVVSLEVSEGINIQIYNEIRARIAPVIQIQQAIEGN